MTAPLRVVGTPAYRADLVRQVQDLNRIASEHQARADVIGAERKRVLAERNGRVPSGEASVSPLTECAVRAIRSDPRGSRVIGREYGVSHTTVLKVKRGLRWKGCLDG